MNYIKKIKVLIFLIIIILIIGISNYKSEDYITKVLKTSNYSYLPKEAKNFIKDGYYLTGSLILTEKNKKDNMPYLNPSFIEYLTMSSEEQSLIDVVPSTYIINYTSSSNNTNIPSSYDLRDINNTSYISSLKNQENTGLCWAFSTIENAETLLRLNNSNNNTTFSVRQLDYATSINGLIAKSLTNSNNLDYSNSLNGVRNLKNDGGSFNLAVVAMANGISLFDDSYLSWNTSSDKMDANDILNYNNSLYEVNSSIDIPVIDSDSSDDDTINNYVNSIKSYMLEYGGPYIGTISPESSCGFKNTDSNYAMVTDSCYSSNLDYGHALQIIGWDDDYEYSYCDNDSKHTSLINNSCSSGVKTTGKGAWILRNSWGNSKYSYFYLSYSSTRLVISFITDISSMSNRSWDNNYHYNPFNDNKLSFYVSNNVSETFTTNNKYSEKIEKIKFYNYSANSKYSLSISSNNKIYNNIITINTTYPGIYTFDLSDKNILVDGDFTINISSNNYLIYNSISVFTSNYSSNKSIITYSDSSSNIDNIVGEDNIITLEANLDEDNPSISFSILSYLKNFTDTNFSYKLRDNNNIYDTFGDISLYVVGNEVEADFYLTNNDTNSSGFTINYPYDRSFYLDIFDNDEVIEEIPILIKGNGIISTSQVTLYSNNSNDSFITLTKENYQEYNFKLDCLNSIEFFNNGYYIKGWNTEKDYSGISYDIDQDILIDQDTNLYAEWSNIPLFLTINYNCSDTSICTSSMSSDVIEYGSNYTFKDNNFNYSSQYGFIYYYINNKDNYYYEEENIDITSDIIGYPVFNNYQVNIYGYIDSSYNNISFYSDSDTMKSINIKNRGRLKSNLFKKNNSNFKCWSIDKDSNTCTYSDLEYIDISSNINLYAVWDNELFKTNSYYYDKDNNYVILENILIDEFLNNINILDNYNVEVLTNNNGNLYSSGKVIISDSNNKKVEEITTIILGDLNLDGFVNSSDITYMKHIINKSITSNSIINTSCDVNNDGYINSSDVVLLKKFIVKKTSLLKYFK
jgi:hypothetical protein